MSKSKLDGGQWGWLMPEWPASSWVHACTTTRSGGISEGSFASLNLAEHVGDDVACVTENRRRLQEALHLPATPLWLQQVHGSVVVDAAVAKPGCEADASFATRPGIVCTVLTADCLPLLLCDGGGTRVAAVCSPVSWKMACMPCSAPAHNCWPGWVPPLDPKPSR